MYFLTIFVSCFDIITGPFAALFIFFVLFVRLCLLPLENIATLPVPVVLNLFFVPLFVLIFGKIIFLYLYIFFISMQG